MLGQETPVVGSCSVRRGTSGSISSSHPSDVSRPAPPLRPQWCLWSWRTFPGWAQSPSAENHRPSPFEDRLLHDCPDMPPSCHTLLKTLAASLSQAILPTAGLKKHSGFYLDLTSVTSTAPSLIWCASPGCPSVGLWACCGIAASSGFLHTEAPTEHTLFTCPSLRPPTIKILIFQGLAGYYITSLKIWNITPIISIYLTFF